MAPIIIRPSEPHIYIADRGATDQKNHGSDRFSDQSHGSDHFSDQQKKKKDKTNKQVLSFCLLTLLNY